MAGETALPAVEPRMVVVQGGSTNFRQEVTIGPHRLLIDEPKEVGGSDEGPSPYETLLAALGSCTAMTLKMYAEKRQWPLERVTVRLRHFKVHAQDCVDCDKKEAKIDRIERLLELHGSLTEEQRSKLLEMAERCPVHQTVRSATLDVQSVLVPAH